MSRIFFETGKLQVTAIGKLILILLLIHPKGLFGQEYVIPVNPEVQEIALNNYSIVFTDSSSQLSAKEILKLPNDAWQNGIIEGYCTYPMWAKFTVRNVSEEGFEKVIYLNNPFVQLSDIYTVVDDSILSFKTTGLAVSMTNKLYSDPMFPLSIYFPPKSEITIMQRVYDPISTMYAPPYILSFRRAQILNNTRMAFSYLWIGAQAISLILALFMFVVLGRKIFSQYIFLGLSTAMIIIPNIGAIFFFVDSDPHQWVSKIYQFGAAFLIVFMPRFLNCIVPIAQMKPWVWKVMQALAFIGVGLCSLNFIPIIRDNLGFIEVLINYLVYASMIVFAYLLVILGLAAFQRLEHAVVLFIVYVIYLTLAFFVVITPFLGLEIEDLNAFYFLLAGSAFETVAFLLLMARVMLGIYNERNKLNEQVRQSQKLMIDSIVKGQEDERKRFAKDLHDGFGAMITSLNLYIKSLEEEKSASLEMRMSVFESSKKVLKEMYSELRNICFNLMPQTLIKAGVGKTLEEFAGRINQSNEVFVSVNLFGMEERLTELQEISIYRVCQEWVNNVLKYSDATRIDIQLTRDETEITLLVEDDGMGFDKNILIHSTGNGWKNMTSRAELIKGTLELDTQKDVRNSTLIMEVPLNIMKKSSTTLEVQG